MQNIISVIFLIVGLASGGCLFFNVITGAMPDKPSPGFIAFCIAALIALYLIAGTIEGGLV